MDLINHYELPIKELGALKEMTIVFEDKLGRETNLIDIVGEIELCQLFELNLVKNKVNEGFDAVKNKKRYQIKSTRKKGSNYRVSTILKNPELVQFKFDFLLLARYDSNLKLESVYKMSAKKCEEFFNYINSFEMYSKRKNQKKYKDISIGQLVRWAEAKYDFDKKDFIKNKN